MYATCYPATAAIRTTEPTLQQEPVTPEQVKAQLGLQGNGAHDQWITETIPAARWEVEHDADLVCYTGAHTWKFTEFPCRDWFELPSRPVTAVSSITYVATDGTTTTWSSSEYVLDTASLIPVVRYAYGYSWPALRGDMNGVTVAYTAGYASVLAIPARIKQAVLLAIHIKWLQKMENTAEAERQQVGYERQIELIRRTTYR